MGTRLQQIDEKLVSWEHDLRTMIQGKEDWTNLAHSINTISQVHNAVNQLENAVRETQKTIQDARIPASLQRFDQWFRLFLRSQNFRWILIDVAAPTMAGIAALILLATHI